MKLLPIILLFFALNIQAQTKYAIMSDSAYYKFNARISVLKNYEIGKATERVFPMTPTRFCMVDSVLKIVVPISVENQAYVNRRLFERNEFAYIDTIRTDSINIVIPKLKNRRWIRRHYDKMTRPEKRKLKIRER
jgi:hypothetical protein